MSVQKEQQMETSNLPEKDEREYWPRSHIHIFITEKDRKNNERY
jgi:hypothetical protein